MNDEFNYNMNNNNIINNNNNNWEAYINDQGLDNGHSLNNNNNNIPNNLGQEPIMSGHGNILQNKIKINDLTLFDNRARDLLSKGNKNKKDLQEQMTTHKHKLLPSEYLLFQNDYALLAGGYVLVPDTKDVDVENMVQLKNVTESENLQRFTLNNPIAINFSIQRQKLNKDINKRTKYYPLFNLSYYVKLINATCADDWDAQYKKKHSESLNVHLKQEIFSIASFQGKDEKQHKTSNAKSTKGVSSGIANKLDVIILMNKDKVFANLYLNNIVSGISDQKKYILDRQKENQDSVQINSGALSNFNNELMKKMYNEKIAKNKIETGMFFDMMNETEVFKFKLAKLFGILGIESTSHQVYTGLKGFHFKKIQEGLKKSMKQSNTQLENSMEKQVYIEFLKEYIDSFFTGRM